MKRGHKIILALGLLIALVASAMATLGMIPVSAQTNTYTAKYIDGAIPLDPTDPAWSQVDKGNAVLVAQLLTYPQRLDTQPRQIQYAVVHNGTHIAVYLEWSDDTEDVPGPGELDKFPDAVAVQFPVKSGEQPYVCMGMQDNPVHIVMWKAGKGAESLVAGSGYGTREGEDTARGLHSVPTSPIATLPPEEQVWKSKATYEDGKWKVVLVRPTGSVGEYVPELDPGSEVSIAFALWDGSKYERAGSKVTSGWQMLELEKPAAGVETVTETVTETATETVTATTTLTETTTLPAATGSVKAAIVGFLAALIIAIIMLALLYRKGALKGGQ